MDLNEVTLIGNIGKDGYETMINGSPAMLFSICTNSLNTTSTGEVRKYEDWHDVVLWNKSVDMVGKYIRKGARVMVRGKVTYMKTEHEGRTFKSARIWVTDLHRIDTSRDEPIRKDEDFTERGSISSRLSQASNKPKDDDFFDSNSIRKDCDDLPF